MSELFELFKIFWLCIFFEVEPMKLLVITDDFECLLLKSMVIHLHVNDN